MSVEKCSSNYRSLIKKLISSFIFLIMILIRRYDTTRLSAFVDRLPEMLFAVAQSKTFISLRLKTLTVDICFFRLLAFIAFFSAK